eukprot:3794493-Amphidinium_carterae.1
MLLKPHSPYMMTSLKKSCIALCSTSVWCMKWGQIKVLAVWGVVFAASTILGQLAFKRLIVTMQSLPKNRQDINIVNETQAKLPKQSRLTCKNLKKPDQSTHGARMA